MLTMSAKVPHVQSIMLGHAAVFIAWRVTKVFNVPAAKHEQRDQQNNDQIWHFWQSVLPAFASTISVIFYFEAHLGKTFRLP
jgi:hypothetical protein